MPKEPARTSQRSRPRAGKALAVPEAADLAAAIGRRAPRMADDLVAFLAAAGLDARVIRRVLRDAAGRVTSRSTGRTVDTADIWTQVSDAVAMWFRDARYVDDDGRALAIAERGPPPSVDHLLTTCVEPRLRERARRLLRDHADVDRRGRWTYTLPEAALRLRDDAIAERLQLAVARLYDNFLFNSRFVAEPQRKNFDRVAAVSAFPVSMLPALRRRMQRQLALAVYDADAWLMKQQRARSHGKVCDAGVGVYLFTGKPRTRPSGARGPAKKDARQVPTTRRKRAARASRTARGRRRSGDSGE